MNRSSLPRHGANHAAEGSDPIPGLGGGGDGIQFDIDNEGNFLRVFTSGDDGEGNGIWLDTAGAYELKLSSEDDDVEVQAGRDFNVTASGDIFQSSDGDATLKSVSGRAKLQGGTSTSVSAATELRLGGASVVVTSSTGGVTIFLQNTSTTLDVLDSNGDPIFRVDEDGDLHGKTGKALTFDL